MCVLGGGGRRGRREQGWGVGGREQGGGERGSLDVHELGNVESHFNLPRRIHAHDHNSRLQATLIHAAEIPPAGNKRRLEE